MSLKLLQTMAGVTPDGKFGPNTFKAAKEYLGIESDIAAVHFFAQTGHETGNFTKFVENLNYSADGLRATWPKRFPGNTADAYHRQPERIANKVYANRIGNGDEASGDGWKFRGRGALQLTGRENYQKFSVFVNDHHEVLQKPEKVENEYSFLSAMFFFKNKKLWEICEKGLDEATIKNVTQIINGGQNGIEHRIELTNKYKEYI